MEDSVQPCRKQASWYGEASSAQGQSESHCVAVRWNADLESPPVEDEEHYDSGCQDQCQHAGDLGYGR